MAQKVAPAVRIVNPIDESQLVTLAGNTHPAAIAKNDRGPVSPGLPMTDLVLVLSRSPEQQTAFDTFVASLNDTNSPNYHQWLTPEQVGELYGPSTVDIATITGWLNGHGFTVTQVTKDRMSIRFGGTANMVHQTFHTEIHNLVVNGVPHIGNMSDPQIPAAIAPVVVGIKSLHNFFPRPAHHMGQLVQHNQQTGKWVREAGAAATAARTFRTESAGGPARPALAAKPEFGISVGSPSYLVEDVGPWDFATIYNVAPLWTSGIDGTGHTIAIAGTSAIDIGESSTAIVGANGSNDVATFRTFFNLPTNNAWNQPIQMSGNSQPLTVCSSTLSTALCGLSDLEENSLDVEWSGAVAKNAQIVLVASYPASPSDDNLYDSESYIIDHLTAHIMNVSYGACELGLGTAGNVQYYNLWETAAAEGIAVFVATGDSGSASCDQGGDANGVPAPAENGLSVSGLASTPFNTAVGGTDFAWCPLTSNDGCASEASTYWNTTNSSTTEANAKGYIPELPWNDTCVSPLALPYMKSLFNGTNFYGSYIGSGGQTLTVTDAESGCNALGYYAQQLEQDNAGGLLYLVDTVGGSGGPSSCVVSTTDPTGTTLGTCTSGSTTTGSSNGNIPLVNNGWPKPSWQTGVSGIPSDGVRDIPDVSFFASDGFLSSSAYLICVSAASVDPECTYNTSTEPFAEEVGGTSVATPAMAGVMALINQKTGAAQGNPNAELYTLAAKQNYGGCSSESATTSSNCYFNDIDQGTNAMACDYFYYVTTPSPNCSIIHTGDYLGILPGYSATTGYDQATGLGSLNIANVVNGWTAVVGLAKANVTVTPQPASINSNNSLSVTVAVAGTGTLQDPDGQTVVPTGTVTLTATGSAYSSTQPLNSSGSYTFTVPANSLPGSATGQLDTLTAKYAGDIDYAATSNTGQVTVTTVVLLTPTITVTPASQTISSNASLNVTVSVSGTGATPTGTITLSGGGLSATTETIGTSPCASAASCVFAISANTLNSNSTGESDTLTAAYSGDNNYANGSNTAQVTVTESTFKLTPGTPSSASVTPGQSATVSVTVAALAGYTGSVSLTCQQSSTTASGGDGTTCTGGGSGTAVNLTSSNTSGTVTFTISTSPPVTAELARPKMPGKGWLGAGSGTVLAVLIFFGIPARRRSWRNMLGVLVALVVMGTLSSCGGGGSGGGGGGGGQNDPGTTAGTYTYSVTATPTPSVSPTVTTTFNVTVN
ncbi:MAG: protease pro-enzyme activation domain-containing protein [Terracidiphilus sp.]